jgi:predicted transcriptional regulator
MARAIYKKLRLSASVTAKQKAALEEIAKRSEVSTSRVIQEAIKEFLDRHGEQELPLFTGQFSSE